MKLDPNATYLAASYSEGRDKTAPSCILNGASRCCANLERAPHAEISRSSVRARGTAPTTVCLSCDCNASTQARRSLVYTWMIEDVQHTKVPVQGKCLTGSLFLPLIARKSVDRVSTVRSTVLAYRHGPISTTTDNLAGKQLSASKIVTCPVSSLRIR